MRAFDDDWLIIAGRTKAGAILCSPRRREGIEYLISIGASDEPPPAGFRNVKNRLRLIFADEITTELGGPSLDDVRRIVELARHVSPASGRILVQCQAGVSRSAAAAVIVLAVLAGPGAEVEIRDHLQRHFPEARPNPLMLRLADELLGTRLAAALQPAITIRSERADDVSAIFAVHAACFPTSAEAEIVDGLRAAGRLTVSLVAEAGGAIVGHVAFSPVTAANGATGVGLGPVAVLASRRRQGVADRLIREGLAACAAAGCGWAVVLGSPAYYSRFGFVPASSVGLSDEYGGGAAFQALELLPGRLPAGAGLARYAPEFALASE